MSGQDAFWDPIEGAVAPEFRRRPEREPSKLPASFKKLELPLFFLAFPGFILAFLGDSLLPYGIALVTFGMAGGFAINHFTGATEDRLERLWKTGEHLGFRFRPEIPASRLRDIRQKIPELFKLRIGGSIPLNIESEMWGRSESGTPLWLGLGAFSSAAFFGGPKQTTKLANAGAQGNVVMMIAAYKLDRDTGIRIVLMPESLGAVGPFDRDLKTESVAFNDTFNIRVTSRADDGDLDQISVNVLQVLTPAFQTTLLELADRFAARVIVDRDTVYFGGFHNLQSLDDTVLQSFVKEIVAAFAAASTSFKRYAE